MAEDDQWNYGFGSESRGPVDDEEMKRLFRDGVIHTETLVWRQGMADWVPLRETDLIAISGAPPLPPQAASTDMGQDAGMRMLLPVGRSALAIAAGYMGLFAILVLPAPFALLLGILAVRDIKKHPEKHGLGRAWFAIIIGGLVTVVTGLVLLYSMLEQ